MFDPSAPHIIILLVVVLLLFGARRLPGAAKSLGESMHIFKKSVQGLNVDDDPSRPFAEGGGATMTQPSSSFTSSTPPASIGASADATQQQLADMQRQIAELQRQNANGGGSQLSETQSSQPF
jgi:sec-independent protein translocase protein TatA